MISYTNFINEEYDHYNRQGFDMIVNGKLKIMYNLKMLDDNHIKIEFDSKLIKVKFKNTDVIEEIKKITGIMLNRNDPNVVKMLKKLPAQSEIKSLKD